MKIAVFSGATATVANSPPLVTSNKGRLSGEPMLKGKYDTLVPQILYESVTIKIKKFSAHPLELDSSEIYHDNGASYYEVTLSPEDGPYPLPYMARRKNGSPNGIPFEASDQLNPLIDYGGRQFFYPDASRIFNDIDRTLSGRSKEGTGDFLSGKATYEFIRVLPPGGYKKSGEIAGVDYFPYSPAAIAKTTRVKDLAKLANVVQDNIDRGNYSGALWLDGSPHLEETLFWLNLLIDTDIPIVGVASQRFHGELSNDGDRNIVDGVDFILSGKGIGLGVVAVLDQQIFAARELKKTDARPGNYKALGGGGGILGSIKSSNSVKIWYAPKYKHTCNSEVNPRKLPSKVEFFDRSGTDAKVTVQIKLENGYLDEGSMPRVHIMKYGGYTQEDEFADPDEEVDIIARIKKAELDQLADGRPKLHGLVFEGTSSFGLGAISQMKAIEIAAMSGIPVVRVARGDPGGPVIAETDDLTIAGSNLDANKARLLLIASLMKLGRLPRAEDPRNPTQADKRAVIEKILGFQDIFDNH